jgi:hypothetical protein
MQQENSDAVIVDGDADNGRHVAALTGALGPFS